MRLGCFEGSVRGIPWDEWRVACLGYWWYQVRECSQLFTGILLVLDINGDHLHTYPLDAHHSTATRPAETNIPEDNKRSHATPKTHRIHHDDTPPPQADPARTTRDPRARNRHSGRFEHEPFPNTPPTPASPHGSTLTRRCECKRSEEIETKKSAQIH